MKWFDRWFSKKVRQSWDEEACPPDQPRTRAMLSSSKPIERSLGDHPMNLQIHRANGGYILEFSTYDRKRDEHDRNLHIVTQDQDLGESIAQIITVEMLRN
jgi:hypothetical protein